MNDIIDEFRNNLFCRRDSNQRKAKKLWETINVSIPEPDRTLFETEWSHYLNWGPEITQSDMGYYLQTYVLKHF
jgi:hypothetical protein